MSILALDVGKKRIGLAVSDALGLTAQGLPTLHRTRIREDIAHLAAVINERSVTMLLIGKPVHMSGRDSRQSAYTEEFAERLQAATGIPVVYRDERLTTAEADRILHSARATIAERKQAIDRMAAVLLLDSYLESERIAAAAGDDTYRQDLYSEESDSEESPVE